MLGVGEEGVRGCRDAGSVAKGVRRLRSRPCPCSGGAQKKKRRRIDRTMIGEPMNFVHLTHIGSGEMGAGDGLAMVTREWGEVI
ncbi:hypothetical protein EI555_007641 [Monodon monoceros]|uniref:CDC42 small effector protein 1 n=1 Tax=Monodon monoceros TaxID=40151 RepID=A0A4U1F1J3_MONMO|nr:hypothetical protein EI555_007641 [Monodon monoceros]